VATKNAGGTAVAGFLLSGFLLALLGAILPAWGYHRDPADFVAVGNHFLALAVGLVGATPLAQTLMRRKGLSFLLVFACALSGVALLYLGFVSPPVSPWWRTGGLLVLGIGAGLLNMGLFHALSAAYAHDAAGTVYRSGIWYGLGCLAATMLVEGTFYAYGVTTILVLMAVLPLVFAVVYSRVSLATPPAGEHPTMSQALKDFRSPGAVLFALLLFFQFGNEWAIAGWLPILLIRRIGLSPKEALFILGLYWLFLLGGRLLVMAVLSRVRHGRLLLASALTAVFGCLILFLTNNAFGAGSGAFFLGAGFASIYPLVAEAIGRRFPYYHPGFFNGIFSLALLGGLLAPATLGYAAASVGVGVVIGIPLLGTIMVAILLSLIWLESKVTGR
jgi:fucose permease